MIRFFRKIRQSLLSQNRISKYLLYALGEILLVMIGILLALQVNNWNEERKDLEQEKNILIQLDKEYRENLDEINQKINLRETMASSIVFLLNVSIDEIDKVHLDTLGLYISRTTIRPTFDPAEGITKEILNSGKLYVLRNQELRNHLSNWSGMVNKVLEEERDLVLFTMQEYYQYRIRNFKLLNMWSADLKAKHSNSLLLSKIHKSTFEEIKGTKDIEEFSKYLKDPVIKNFLIRIHKSCINTNAQAHALKTKIEELLIIIEGEMNRFKYSD